MRSAPALLRSLACTGTSSSGPAHAQRARRSTSIPLVDIQKALSAPYNFYFAAKALAVDIKGQWVTCQDLQGHQFRVHYDKLAISTGSQGSTFGIPGVEQHALFLREVAHAAEIRQKLLKNWNLANIPGRPRAERLRLLHTVIVGGGPTGVEFAGELTDFILQDLSKVDPGRAKDARVTLIEANEVLGSFDARMREYAATRLHKQGVHLIQGVVQEIGATQLKVSDGQRLEYGLCVWSTGVGPTEFTTSLPFAKTARGRIAINGSLQVLVHPDQASGVSDPSHPSEVPMGAEEHPEGSQTEHLRPLQNVFALGDCCANIGTPLPALAQVAEQQGGYLAKILNQQAEAPAGIALHQQPFQYHSAGAMATVGTGAGVLQGPPSQKPGHRPRFALTGWTSWFAWRSAYLTKIASWRKRTAVASNWLATLAFGRDMSSF